MQQSNNLPQPDPAPREPEQPYPQPTDSARLEALADAWLAGEGRISAEDPAAATRIKVLLQELVAPTEPLQPAHLLAFSDLDVRAAADVQEQWPLIPAERRRAVVTYLVELAESDLYLQLGRILRIALHDEDAIVRRDAVRGLWEEVSSDLVGPLLHLLRSDPDVRVREVVAETLGAYVLAGELDEFDAALAFRVEETLLAVLTDEEESLDVRCRALESIAYSGENGVRQLIEDAYYAPEESMRVSALTAMGRSADTRWRGLVRAELQNPAPEMRLEAAIACGELDAKAAVNELIGLLDDEEQPIRGAAMMALGRIGGKNAREALQAMRQSDDPLDVEAADLALEELLFFADPANALGDAEEEMDQPDVDPWEIWRDLDDDELGAYGD